MNVLILTVVGTVFAAVVESLIYYVRFKNGTPRLLQRAVMGAVLWGVGIAALRWDRAPLAAILVHGAVGSILWFVVVFALSRVLWRSASRSPKRRRSRR